MCFEDMSGLKINFHKSEVIVLDAQAEEQASIANKFNCKQGAFPFIYLGLPISDRKLSLEQWLFLVRRLASKLEPWLGRLLSSGGRLVLSNSCLDNLPMLPWASSCSMTASTRNLTQSDQSSSGKEQAPIASITWLTADGVQA
jgi:hypothetical protein